jgi:hypothetical protein
MTDKSEFIIDTGKTRTEPIDYSWRNQPGAGCKECGCIMAAQGSHCFCMGIYTCPRCGYESKGLGVSELKVDFSPTGVMIDQLKELSQEDRNKVLRHFCRGCNRYLEEGEVCYCDLPWGKKEEEDAEDVSEKY